MLEHPVYTSVLLVMVVLMVFGLHGVHKLKKLNKKIDGQEREFKAKAKQSVQPS